MTVPPKIASMAARFFQKNTRGGLHAPKHVAFFQQVAKWQRTGEKRAPPRREMALSCARRQNPRHAGHAGQRNLTLEGSERIMKRIALVATLIASGVASAQAVELASPWPAGRYDNTFVPAPGMWSGYGSEYPGWGRHATSVFSTKCCYEHGHECCNNVWDGYCAERKCWPFIDRPRHHHRGCGTCGTAHHCQHGTHGHAHGGSGCTNCGYDHGGTTVTTPEALPEDAGDLPPQPPSVDLTEPQASSRDNEVRLQLSSPYNGNARRTPTVRARKTAVRFIRTQPN